MARALVDLDLNVIRDNDNDRAILVQDDDGKKVWLPRSMIEIDYDGKKQGRATITMPEHLAIEKGLV
jgi:hypothetical protein